VPDLYENFREIVQTLDERGIPFAVCGGLAMAIHARPRATVDIDLLVPSDAIAALGVAAATLGFRVHPTAMVAAGGSVVIHRLTKIVPGDPDVLVLDVIEARPGPTDAAWASRVTREWEGRSVSAVSREALIALKRLRGSLQDLADIAALEQPE
jgi:hypothetical protein